MSSVEERLRAAGIELADGPTRLGRYVPGVRDGRTVYVSGQTGTRDGEPVWAGVVGGSVTVEEAEQSARLAAINALTALRAVVPDLDHVRRVARTTVYICAVEGFTEHPRIADAATAVFESAFGEAGRGARSAIGVHTLPQGAPVELDLIVLLEDDLGQDQVK